MRRIPPTTLNFNLPWWVLSSRFTKFFNTIAFIATKKCSQPFLLTKSFFNPQTFDAQNLSQLWQLQQKIYVFLPSILICVIGLLAVVYFPVSAFLLVSCRLRKVETRRRRRVREKKAFSIVQKRFRFPSVNWFAMLMLFREKNVYPLTLLFP